MKLSAQYLTNKKLSLKGAKGFTLIELLVVIGILAILLAIVLIAINPARQFQQANDTQRSSDVNAILNAVHQYMVENNGQAPGSITATPTDIGSATVDLCAVLVSDFIADLPMDPTAGTVAPDGANCAAATSYSTGYQISTTADNRITVAAPNAEGDDAISVTR